MMEMDGGIGLSALLWVNGVRKETNEGGGGVSRGESCLCDWLAVCQWGKAKVNRDRLWNIPCSIDPAFRMSAIDILYIIIAHAVLIHFYACFSIFRTSEIKLTPCIIILSTP